jgi:hypothetical protein
MPTYALVDTTSTVTNRIVLDDPAAWSVPEGYTLVLETTDFEIGGTYSNGVYVPPPAPPTPIAPVPKSVTPKQARLALSAAGLLTQVNAMVRVAPEATQIAWDYGLSVDRNDPMLLTLVSQITPPMTDAQVDQLFVEAAAIT